MTTQPPASVTEAAVIGGASPGVRVTVEDAFGNPVLAATNVTMALTANPLGVTLGGTTTVAASASTGIATFGTLTLPTVPPTGTVYSLTATSGTLTSATTNTFSVTNGAVSKLLVTTQPPTTVAAATTFKVSVAAVDANNNPVLTYATQIGLTLTGTGGTLTGGGLTTPSNGAVTFTLSVNNAGTYGLNVTSGTLTTIPTSSFTVATTTAAATKLVATSVPASTRAGTALTVAVQAQNSSSSPINTFNAPVTLTLASGPAGGVLEAPINSTIAITNGGSGYTSAPTVTFSAPFITATALASLTSSDTVGAITVTNGGAGYTGSAPLVTFSGGGGSGAAATAVVNSSGVVTGLTITAAGSGYTAAPTLTIAAPRGAGTTATGTATFNSTTKVVTGITVTLTGSGYIAPPTITFIGGGGTGAAATATLGTTVIANGTSGTASFTGLTLNIAGSYTFTATSNGLASVTTTPATPITAGPFAVMVVTTPPPATVNAGTAFTLNVTAEDAYGNPITNLTSNTASLAVNTGTAGATFVTPSSPTFNSAGVASFTGLKLNQVGTYTLKVTNNVFPSGITAITSPFNVVAGTAASLVVATPPPPSVVAGSTTGNAYPFGLVIEALDANGNLATSYVTPVVLSITSGTGISGATLDGTASVSATPVGGVATFTNLTINNSGTAAYQLNTTNGLIVTTPPFTVTPAPVSQLVFTTAPPTSATAGTAFPVAVTAEDANGNTVPGYTAPVTIAFGTNPGGSTLNGGSSVTVTPANGVATFTSLTVNKPTTSTSTLVASSNGLPSKTSSDITTIVAGAYSQLVVTTQPTPSSITAGGGTSGTFSVAVTAEDPQGNPLNVGGTATITVATGPGTISSAPSTQTATFNSSGVATFTGLTINTANTTASPSYTFTVTSSVGSMTATTSALIVTAAATNLEILPADEPSPSPVQVGAGFSVTVRAVDVNNNVFPGYNGLVTLTFAPGGNPNGGAPQWHDLGVGLRAEWRGDVQRPDDQHDRRRLHAPGDGERDPGAVTTTSFNTTAAPATQLKVTTGPTPSNITAGGTFSLTVTAEDQFGNTDTTFGSNGQMVTLTLASNPGGATFAPVTVAASGGVATFTGLTLTTAAAGYTFNVLSNTSPSLTGATRTAVTVVPAAPFKVVLNTQPSSNLATGSLFGFTAKVEDQYGNAVAGYPGSVTVAAAPGNSLGGATFTPVAVSVSPTGLATSRVC